jgi:hypothetical protein
LFVNLEFVDRAAAVPKTGGAAKASQGSSADQRVVGATKDTPIGHRSVAIPGSRVGGTERVEYEEVAVRINAIDDAIAIRASVGGGRIHRSVVAKSQTRVGIGSVPILPDLVALISRRVLVCRHVSPRRVNENILHCCSKRAFTRRNEVTGVSVFDIVVARL